MSAEQRRVKFGHGPRPKPVELKLLEGNPGGKPLNIKRPKPIRTRLQPTSELNEDGLKEWKRLEDELHRLGLLTMVDLHALTNLCQTWAFFLSATRAINAAIADDPVHHGMTVVTPTGGLMSNPAASNYIKASAALTRVCAELGFSPASRGKVVLDDEDDTSKFKGLLATG